MTVDFRMLLSLIVAAAGAAGCGDAVAPTGPLQSFGFSVSGPSSVAPGGTASFRALDHLSDGTTVDVSSQVTWRSLSPDVLAIQTNGVAQAVGRGEATLVAHYRQSSAFWPVLVIEDGTFVLSGTIKETHAGVNGLFDAGIEVIQGIGAGLRTRSTDFTGAFALYGVAGPIQLRVSANGYETATIAINVTQRHTESIVLTPTSTPPGGLTGAWSLTLISPPCDWPPGVPQQFDLSADLLETAAARLVATVKGAGVVYAEPLLGQLRSGEITLPLAFLPGDVIDGPYYALQLAAGADGSVGVRGIIRALPAGESAIGIFEGAMDYYRGPVWRNDKTVCEGTSTVTLRRVGQSLEGR